jgi:hypothetical protein
VRLEPIDLTGADLRDEGVPVVVRLVVLSVERDDAGRLGGILAIEEQEVDLARAPGVDAEVDTAERDRRA